MTIFNIARPKSAEVVIQLARKVNAGRMRTQAARACVAITRYATNALAHGVYARKATCCSRMQRTGGRPNPPQLSSTGEANCNAFRNAPIAPIEPCFVVQ